MRAQNPIETLAEAVYSAIHNPNYLPNIEYKHQTPQQRRDGVEGETKQRRPRTDEIEVYHFPQTWGSTALGFGGMGGAAMTSAYTTVVMLLHRYAAVFFSGGHAYTVEVNETFFNDLHKSNMAAVSEIGRYAKSA